MKDSYKIKDLLSIFSLLLILIPMYSLDEESTFPYFNAIPTAVGTAFLIYLRGSIVSHFLALKPLVLIGLLSYSLYLYHWPVIVYINYQFEDLGLVAFYSFVILLSFILALMSYYLVENLLDILRKKILLLYYLHYSLQCFFCR